MFGFQEGEYSVELRSELRVGKGTQVFEIRRQPAIPEFELPPELRARTEPRKLPLYIAVEGLAPDGQSELDVLLFYKADEEAAMRDDWQKLTTDGDVRFKDLGWDERVVYHATGYFKDGGVAMY